MRIRRYSRKVSSFVTQLGAALLKAVLTSFILGIVVVSIMHYMGVSIRELKAAHRDLAKVWHPDRFVHDPRLQEKAQEKLKEINEAFDLISSGKTPRPAQPEPVYDVTPRRPSR